MNPIIRIYKKEYIFLAATLLVGINSFEQELVIPRLNLKQTLIQKLGTCQLKINYSRPSMK